MSTFRTASRGRLATDMRHTSRLSPAYEGRNEAELTEQHILNLIPPKFRDAVKALKEKGGWRVHDKYTFVDPRQTVGLVATPGNVVPKGIMLEEVLKGTKYVGLNNVKFKVMVDESRDLDTKVGQRLYKYFEELSRKPGVEVSRFEKTEHGWFGFEGLIPLEDYRREMRAKYVVAEVNGSKSKYELDDVYGPIRLFGKPERVGVYGGGVLVLDYNDFKILAIPTAVSS